jgi:hypothetical protein
LRKSREIAVFCRPRYIGAGSFRTTRVNRQAAAPVETLPSLRDDLPWTTERMVVARLKDGSFERGRSMANPQIPHPGHERHLCYLNNLGFQISNPEEYKELVRNGRFMCKVCGRVAANEKNLCKPVEL